MNRSFPGRPDGTVTQMIAHYVATVLVPRADLVLDLHSGGRTLDFVPFAATHRLADKALEARAIAAVEAFRSEEHTSELQSLMRNSYAVFFLKQKKHLHLTNNTY